MTEIRGSAFVQKLFHTTSYAWVWLLLRLWLGWHWFEAGWHKVGNPNWMENGNALRGFLTRATTIPEGGTSAPAVYEWYRSFLQFLLEGGHYTWFAKLVVFGEILVGIGLIIGGFTAIAAFFGAVMNMSFMLAGTVSSNPVMFTAAILIMLAWKVAGWYGLDRWLLHEVGTPWQPGRAIARLLDRDKTQPQVG